MVRILRRNRKESDKVAGVVERIGKAGRKGFLDPESLWKILTTPWEDPDREGETPRKGRRGKGVLTLSEIMKRFAG